MTDTVRLLVTGDRDWTNRSLVYDVIYNTLLSQRSLSLEVGVILTHGDADGADKIAGWATRDLQSTFKIAEDPHPAEWYKQGPAGRTYFDRAAGPKRNEKMLSLSNPSVSHVHAFHNDIESSKGTKHCVLSAIKRRINVTLHTEYGSVDIPAYDQESFEFLPQKEAERLLSEAARRLHPLSW